MTASKYQISVHFDGPIANNHTVELRTFSKSLDHLQNAIDRAWLDVKYGNVWKYQRLKDEDYKDTEFLILQTREGGFITDLVGAAGGHKIVERIYRALTPAYDKAQRGAIEEHDRLVEQAEARRQHFKAGAQRTISYEELVDNPDRQQTTAYGDRSIVKEFDQIASAVRARGNDGSRIELDFYTNKALPTMTFDATTAHAFHRIVSVRTLGDPVTIPITLRALDSGRNGGISKAKAFNLISGKEFNLHVHTDRGFSGLRAYLKKRNPPKFEIVAAPVLEYGAFDPSAGDMYLVAIL